MWKYKIKSFGIIEAIVGSVIVIIALSAAVALSSSTTRTTEINSSYREAQHISDSILERINLIKADGRVYFDNVSRGSDMFNIDCFDSEKYGTNPGCDGLSSAAEYPLNQVPYIGNTDDSDHYTFVDANWLDNPSFGSGYFKFNIQVDSLSECKTSGTISIDDSKCRNISVDVRWEEPSGEKNYKQVVYITDWER